MARTAVAAGYTVDKVDDKVVVARTGDKVVVARTGDTAHTGGTEGTAVAHMVSRDSTYSFLLFDSVFGVAGPRQSSSALRQPSHM